MQKNVSFIFPSNIPTKHRFFLFLLSISHRLHKKNALSAAQAQLFALARSIRNCYLSVRITLYFSQILPSKKKNTYFHVGVSDCRQSIFWGSGRAWETNCSLLCYAKQASPAAPSWAVSSFPNGIRSRNSLPTRKTVMHGEDIPRRRRRLCEAKCWQGFKAFKLMELVCLFLCFNKSKTCFRLRVSTKSTP